MKQLALAFLLLLTTACGPRWVVLRQTTPDPFVDRPQFNVEPLHFERAEVGNKPEAAYAAEKGPDQQQSWAADKQGMTERFAVALASTEALQVTQGGPGAIVRPLVTFIEPGFYAGVAASASRVNMTVQIIDPGNGAVIDEIAIQAAVGASMTNPASGTRLRDAAEELGKITGKYLLTRVHPKS